MLCQDEPNPFSLDSGTDGKAKQESDCTLDYITISGSSVSCVQGSQNGNALTNKYCGQKLNPVKEAETNVAICGTFFIFNTECLDTYFCILDCTAPFSVQIVTDALTDKADATTANDDPNNSRGLCLEWTQIPCQG